MKQNKIALALLPGAAVVAVALVGLRLHFQPPTVPDFAIVRDAVASDERSLAPGDRFSLEIRPGATLEGAIAARGFLLRGEEARAWDAPFTVGTDGAVRVEGPVDALFAGVPGGAWEVAILVGRPETLPTAPKDVLRARDAAEAKSPASTASWRLVRERIFLRP